MASGRSNRISSSLILVIVAFPVTDRLLHQVWWFACKELLYDRRCSRQRLFCRSQGKPRAKGSCRSHIVSGPLHARQLLRPPLPSAELIRRLSEARRQLV